MNNSVGGHHKTIRVQQNHTGSFLHVILWKLQMNYYFPILQICTKLLTAFKTHGNNSVYPTHPFLFYCNKKNQTSHYSVQLFLFKSKSFMAHQVFPHHTAAGNHITWTKTKELWPVQHLSFYNHAFMISTKTNNRHI